MRKRYDKEFKAKVALEALKGEKTMQELAITYSVHPNMIALWKRQLMENAAALFEKEGKNKATEEASQQKDERKRSFHPRLGKRKEYTEA